MEENQTTGTTENTSTTKPDKWICEACQGFGIKYNPTEPEGIGVCPYCDGRGNIF